MLCFAVCTNTMIWNRIAISRSTRTSSRLFADLFSNHCPLAIAEADKARIISAHRRVVCLIPVSGPVFQPDYVCA